MYLWAPSEKKNKDFKYTYTASYIETGTLRSLPFMIITGYLHFPHITHTHTQHTTHNTHFNYICMYMFIYLTITM